MAFRSNRGMEGASSFINHMPAFTIEHTYTLAALYPYATRPEGEWAYQAAGAYTFPKGSTLGGRYGRPHPLKSFSNPGSGCCRYSSLVPAST